MVTNKMLQVQILRGTNKWKLGDSLYQFQNIIEILIVYTLIHNFSNYLGTVPHPLAYLHSSKWKQILNHVNMRVSEMQSK